VNPQNKRRATRQLLDVVNRSTSYGVADVSPVEDHPRWMDRHRTVPGLLGRAQRGVDVPRAAGGAGGQQAVGLDD
jgi:hypothetical protein